MSNNVFLDITIYIIRAVRGINEFIMTKSFNIVSFLLGLSASAVSPASPCKRL